MSNIEFKTTFCLFSFLALAGCYPVHTSEDGKSLHINYEKSQNSIACEFIKAWEMEYAHHNRQIKDSAIWELAITINHTRTGNSGLATTGSRTEAVSNWTKVFSAGINHSSTGLYKLTGSFKLSIPGGVYSNESIIDANNGNGELKLLEPFASECANPYLNLKQMAIYSQFESFIKGYNPENKGELKYTNLNFEDTGQIVLSTGGKFTYALVPYEAVLPPALSYTDQINITALATRSLPLTEKQIREAKLKKQRGQKVYVTNINEIQRSSSQKSGSHQFAKPPSKKLTGSNNASIRSLLNTPKGFIADPDRERKRQLLEDQVQEALDDLQ